MRQKEKGALSDSPDSSDSKELLARSASSAHSAEHPAERIHSAAAGRSLQQLRSWRRNELESALWNWLVDYLVLHDHLHVYALRNVPLVSRLRSPHARHVHGHL